MSVDSLGWGHKSSWVGLHGPLFSASIAIRDKAMFQPDVLLARDA